MDWFIIFALSLEPLTFWTAWYVIGLLFIGLIEYRNIRAGFDYTSCDLAGNLLAATLGPLSVAVFLSVWAFRGVSKCRVIIKGRRA